MPISVTISSPEEETRPPLTINMKVKKLLNNDLAVTEHATIDIIIQRQPQKVLTFPRGESTDRVYRAQDRFFKFMVSQGIIDPATIQGGNVFGALEGKFLGDDGELAEQAALLAIKKFIHEEKPLEMLEKELEREQEERLLYPDDDESTELGDISHQAQQGTVKGNNVGAFGTSGSGLGFFEGQRKKYLKKETSKNEP